MLVALVRADDLAGRRDELARRETSPGVRRSHEAGVVLVRDEADLLESGLLKTGSFSSSAIARTVVLLEPADRQQRVLERRRGVMPNRT